MGLYSTYGVDGVRVRGVGSVPDVGVGVDNGNTYNMGDVGVGSMGVSDVSDVGVEDLVYVCVTSRLPWAWEVLFPLACLVDARQGSCWRVGCG